MGALLVDDLCVINEATTEQQRAMVRDWYSVPVHEPVNEYPAAPCQYDDPVDEELLYKDIACVDHYGFPVYETQIVHALFEGKPIFAITHCAFKNGMNITHFECIEPGEHYGRMLARRHAKMITRLSKSDEAIARLGRP